MDNQVMHDMTSVTLRNDQARRALASGDLKKAHIHTVYALEILENHYRPGRNDWAAKELQEVARIGLALLDAGYPGSELEKDPRK
jgi:hypothetical protein